MPGTGCPGGLAGYPVADVPNRANLVLQGPDVRPDDSRSRLGRKFSNWGRKLMIPRAKLERFRGWKVGKFGDMLDPLETKQIHGSNPTKHHQNQQITKKFGAIFGGEFSNLGRNHTKQG